MFTGIIIGVLTAILLMSAAIYTFFWMLGGGKLTLIFKNKQTMWFIIGALVGFALGASGAGKMLVDWIKALF